MGKEIYFDIYSEQKGGTLFLLEDGRFLYQHSVFDADRDDIRVFETYYNNFRDFWKELSGDKEWYYLHPLFVHPQQREFIKEQLKTVDWNIHPDMKWQESHRRQWKKVLEDPEEYYGG